LRPFHATYDAFATQYSVSKTPPELILDRRDREITGGAIRTGIGSRRFWREFRGTADPYMQMLSSTWYANFFLASVPRLDFERYLPRMEFLVGSPVYGPGSDTDGPGANAFGAFGRSVASDGFEVSGEHSMFRESGTLEVLLLSSRAPHDTVKIWGRELLSRVDEYLSAILTRVIFCEKGSRCPY